MDKGRRCELNASILGLKRARIEQRRKLDVGLYATRLSLFQWTLTLTRNLDDNITRLIINTI